jgi:hypothetical protein
MEVFSLLTFTNMQLQILSLTLFAALSFGSPLPVANGRTGDDLDLYGGRNWNGIGECWPYCRGPGGTGGVRFPNPPTIPNRSEKEWDPFNRLDKTYPQ